jgi:hypothetical protein
MKLKIAKLALVSLFGVIATTGCIAVNETATNIGVPKLKASIKIVPKITNNEDATIRLEESFARGLPLTLDVPQGERKMNINVRYFDNNINYTYTDQYGAECGQAFQSMDGMCETASYYFKISITEDDI